MNTKTPIELFIKRRTQSLVDRLCVAKHDKSDVAVRRLRVGIKRWRTLHRLVIKLQGPSGKSGKAERAVERVFKRASAVRTNQLNQQLVSTLKLPLKLEEDLKRHFCKQEKSARKRLRKAIKLMKVNWLKKEARVVRFVNEGISSLPITHPLCQLMEYEADAISELPLINASAEQLHLARKHLKALIELGEVTLTLTPEKLLTHVMPRAITLQQRLGNWHDQIVLINHINHYLARHPTLLTPTKIHAIYGRLETRMQRQTIQIRHEVGKLSQWLAWMTPWRMVRPV